MTNKKYITEEELMNQELKDLDFDNPDWDLDSRKRRINDILLKQYSVDEFNQDSEYGLKKAYLVYGKELVDAVIFEMKNNKG